jgi:hypothetical protein
MILLGLALLLVWLVARESDHFFNELRHLVLPRQETREPLGHGIHGWMAPEDLAHYYHVPVETVFTALDIEPAPGDEELPLTELADKYDKTPADIDAALHELESQQPSRGYRHE